MHTMLETLTTQPDAQLDPVALMQEAQQQTHHAGSSTACVGTLHQDGVLRVANLGDSGLRVVRDGEVVFASQVWGCWVRIACMSYCCA